MPSGSSLGRRLALGYGILCLLAVAFVAWNALVRPGQMELAGVLFVALGLPWSLLATFAVLGIGSSSPWLLSLAFLASCVLNAWLLSRFGNARERRREPPHRPGTAAG